MAGVMTATGLMGDRCVCCGRPVPEGKQVCMHCMKKAFDDCKAEENSERDRSSDVMQDKKSRPAEDRLLEYIRLNHTGKEKGVSSKDLERLFSCNGRTIRKKINKIRQDGKPVCSDQNGYYYAETQEDINKMIRWLNDLVTGESNARTGLLFATLIPLPATMTITIDIDVE